MNNDFEKQKNIDITPEQAQKIADILCEIFNRESGLDVDIKLVPRM